MKDLFKKPELLPQAVQAEIEKFDDNGDLYKECHKLEISLEKLGYIFEWGLDGVPCNLEKVHEVRS